jgi:hypothetical protein
MASRAANGIGSSSVLEDIQPARGDVRAVTNGERARRMLRAADELLAEARKAADYPKVHDVGEVFASSLGRELEQRFLPPAS